MPVKVCWCENGAPVPVLLSVTWTVTVSGPAVVGDGYAAAAASKQKLPTNWFAAVDLFATSPVLREYLGDRFGDMFTSVKRTEQARFFEVVTSLDFDWYLRNA